MSEETYTPKARQIRRLDAKKLSETPGWRDVVKKVQKLNASGMTEDAIFDVVRTDRHVIRKILKDEALAEKYAADVFAAKVPKIQEIISLSLESIHQTLKDIATNEDVRREMIKRASDVGALVKAVTDLNTLLRLELGKSTQNVEVHNHSYQKTREAIQELKKVDPVFDYPELPEPDGER